MRFVIRVAWSSYAAREAIPGRFQEYLRHADIQTTTVYTRLTQHELQQVVSVFDRTGTRRGISHPSPGGT
jgi:integrase